MTTMTMSRDELIEQRTLIRDELSDLNSEEFDIIAEMKDLKARLEAIRDRRSWRREQLAYVRDAIEACKTK